MAGPALSAGAQGLLSGLAGGLGAVEQNYQDEKKAASARSLEDYRFARQKELAAYKNSMSVSLEELKAENRANAVQAGVEVKREDATTAFDREVTLQEDDQTFRAGQTDQTEAGKTHREEIRAGKATSGGKPAKWQIDEIVGAATDDLNTNLLDWIVVNEPGALSEAEITTFRKQIQDDEFKEDFFGLHNFPDNIEAKYKPQYDDAIRRYRETGAGASRSTDPADYQIPNWGDPDTTSVQGIETDAEAPALHGLRPEHPGLEAQVLAAMANPPPGTTEKQIRQHIISTYGEAVWNRILNNRQ